MSPCLALHLPGSPKLELDNAPAAAGRRKTLALLAYLALNRGQHTRDYLSALFWPEYGQSKAFTNLRHTLWETRQAPLIHAAGDDIEHGGTGGEQQD